jgi:hypothetical protein
MPSNAEIARQLAHEILDNWLDEVTVAQTIVAALDAKDAAIIDAGRRPEVYPIYVSVGEVPSAFDAGLKAAAKIAYDYLSDERNGVKNNPSPECVAAAIRAHVGTSPETNRLYTQADMEEAVEKARQETWHRALYLAKAEAFERRQAYCVVQSLEAARKEKQ